MKKVCLLVLLFSCALMAKDPFSSRQFNPDIVLIGDFSYVAGNVDERERFNAREGFNLNYGELYISSAVDPYLDMRGTFHFLEEGVEIDELYVRTRKLPFGFTLQAGKFRSLVGRHNSKHAHTWSFPDPPLVNRLTFGEEGLIGKGAQITWVPPLDLYILIGGEVFQDEGEKALPTGFLKTSVPVSDAEFLVGFSYAGEKFNTFVGEGTLFIPLGAYTSLSIEGEVMKEGYYIQAIFKPLRRWATSARYSRVQKGSWRTSLSVEFKPTEFSRLRVSYSRGNGVNEVIVQLTAAIGAHRAHPF